MFNKLLNASFRAKIIGLVLFLIVFQAGTGLYSVLRFSNKVKESVVKDFQAIPIEVGNRIGAQFFERYGDVQAFAMNETIQSLDPKRIPEVLDAYVKLYGIYDLIVVVDRNGHLISSNTKDAAGKNINFSALGELNFKEEPWFKSVLAGQTTDDKENNFSGTYFEDFMKDEIVKAAVGEIRYGSSFSAPIKNSKGETIAVISNRAGSRWFESDFIANYRDLEKRGMDGAELRIIRQDGTVLLKYVPLEQGSDKKYEVLHDEKVTFVETEKDEDYFSNIKNQVDEWSGYSIDKHTSEHVVLGYHRINNPKWIKNLNWYVTAAVPADDAFAAVNKSMIVFYTLFGVVLVLGLTISVWFAVWMSKKIENIINSLKRNSGNVEQASVSMASQSTELSEASTEQAAALQETVAAVDEISAMVDKNADAANRSQEVSAKSRDTAVNGKKVVEQMMSAIEEINNSNQEIAHEMSENERQMNEITKLINDISNKTKVINEIVFQTKLLSFNASVEAARAGEYGKGFAVVAEEVGNLAQMSGNAAKEITEMLDHSVSKVETMVKESQSHFSKIIASSQQKVELGTRTAQECNSALEEIIENVSSVDGLVSEIAVASKEQSQGIREISKAIGQMEQVTQQNTSVAQSTSHEAEQLSHRSQELNQIVGQLYAWISGDTQGPVAETPVPSSNVVKMQKPGKKPAPQTESPNYHSSTQPSYKKAAGEDSFVPSSDDPGFKE